MSEEKTVTTAISDLVDALRPLAKIAEFVDDGGMPYLPDDTGLWSRQTNFGESFTLTLGDARRARKLLNE